MHDNEEISKRMDESETEKKRKKRKDETETETDELGILRKKLTNLKKY